MCTTCRPWSSRLFQSPRLALPPCSSPEPLCWPPPIRPLAGMLHLSYAGRTPANRQATYTMQQNCQGQCQAFEILCQRITNQCVVISAIDAKLEVIAQAPGRCAWHFRTVLESHDCSPVPAGMTTLNLPKVVTNFTNAASSKEPIRNMLARALDYAKHNCASYEKDRVP